MGRDASEPPALSGRLARLQGSAGPRLACLAAVRGCRGGRLLIVKKLLLLVVAGLGVLAVWRKVQAGRAELDLWTEATTDDD